MSSTSKKDPSEFGGIMVAELMRQKTTENK